MTETILSADVFSEGEEFFFTLDSGETRTGPFPTQEVATESATKTLTELVKQMTLQSIMSKR